MTDKVRPLLVNGHEVVTDQALERAAEARGYRLAPKVRVADVLPIEHSGISSAEYGYALKAHFDWVITDGDDRTPQFAVEFDGASHEDPDVAARDALKDALCRHFDFPLLRIDGTFLRRVRRRPLVEILVEAWAAWKGFLDAQEAGDIAWDEPWMYGSLFDTDPVSGKLVPALAIDAPGRGLVLSLCAKGVTKYPIPTSLIRFHPTAEGNFESHAMIELADGTFVTGSSKIRSYQWAPIPPWELAEDLAIESLRMNLRLWMDGHNIAVSADDVGHIREECPKEDGWLSSGTVHPLWSTDMSPRSTWVQLPPL
jgi:hypothetical protein